MKDEVYKSDMYVNEAVSDCIRICVGVTHRIVSVENQCRRGSVV